MLQKRICFILLVSFVFFMECAKRDNEPPIVKIKEPTNNAFISGIVKIIVEVIDNFYR